MSVWHRVAEVAVRPASMGIALVAQGYLLQNSADGFLVFNGIYATQTLLAHLFYPGIATSAFRAANGFSTIQRRLFFIASIILLASGFIALPFWSAAGIALIGTVLSGATAIMAQYYLGGARPVMSSLLTQIIPWTSLILLVATLQDTTPMKILPLLMVLPSSLIAIRAILQLDDSRLDSGLQINWRLGIYAFLQSFKLHGVSLLAAPFQGAEVAGALFVVKLLSAAQNIVAYAGARRVKHFSILLKGGDRTAQKRGFWTAVREGVFMGLIIILGMLALYFQPYWSGLAVQAAFAHYIVALLGLTALFSPFFITRSMAVNILADRKLFRINVTSVTIFLASYALGNVVFAPSTTILVCYAISTLYFLAALAKDLFKCPSS